MSEQTQVLEPETPKQEPESNRPLAYKFGITTDGLVAIQFDQPTTNVIFTDVGATRFIKMMRKYLKKAHEKKKKDQNYFGKPKGATQ